MAISDTIKRGSLRAPHRSLLRATGVIQSEDDWEKPFIVIANSFVQIIPGHAHLDVVGLKVRAAVRAAGGVPRRCSSPAGTAALAGRAFARF